MLGVSPTYPVLVGGHEPRLMPVERAAAEAGIGEATLWRWLRYKAVKRYKNPPGWPRATRVDLDEVLRVKSNPPAFPPAQEACG